MYAHALVTNRLRCAPKAGWYEQDRVASSPYVIHVGVTLMRYTMTSEPEVHRVVSYRNKDEDGNPVELGWSAGGHLFGERMRCVKCDTKFTVHQRKPRVCPAWQVDSRSLRHRK